MSIVFLWQKLEINKLTQITLGLEMAMHFLLKGKAGGLRFIGRDQLARRGLAWVRSSHLRFRLHSQSSGKSPLLATLSASVKNFSKKRTKKYHQLLVGRLDLNNLGRSYSDRFFGHRWLRCSIDTYGHSSPRNDRPDILKTKRIKF